MNIIGLGKAGCNIAELFKQYPQYKVFLMDTEDKYKSKKDYFYIPPQSSAELYDANPIDLAKLKSSLDEDDELYFIVCGSGKVSACSLWILKELTSKKINIVYIKPDVSSMDSKSLLRNRAHLHILQEYTRSGVFNKMYLFSNNDISEIIGKTSIINYFSKINNLITSLLHWMNIYLNSEPIFDTFREKYISSRICCLSTVDIDNLSVMDTFILKNINQIEYFFGVNRIRIEQDEDLLEKITEVSSLNSEGKSVSYGVFSTDLETGFSFAIKSSSEIQSE